LGTQPAAHLPPPRARSVTQGVVENGYALIVHIVPDGTVVVDLVRERKPRFVPAQVIAEYAELLRSYRVTEVYGDNHAGGFHSSEWAAQSITFRPFKDSTSDNYLAALPSLLARRVKLLNNTTLRNQLTSLERTVGTGDRETVSHPKHGGAHDDVATAVCGAITVALRAARVPEFKPVMPVVLGRPRYIPGSDEFTGRGAPLVSPSAPAASYDYNREQSWKNFVNADGSIRSTPRGGWGFP
jgi:hypothetical protein